MMAKSKLIQVFRNERGFASARPVDPGDLRAASLGYTIADGMQAYLDAVESALAQLESVQRGDLAELVIGGNDQEITVTQVGALYEHHVFPDDPTYQYSLEEVRTALEDWRDLLKTPPV